MDENEVLKKTRIYEAVVSANLLGKEKNSLEHAIAEVNAALRHRLEFIMIFIFVTNKSQELKKENIPWPKNIFFNAELTPTLFTLWENKNRILEFINFNFKRFSLEFQVNLYSQFNPEKFCLNKNEISDLLIT